ncbi:MAG: signal peptidase I [Flavobacteriales bacterium]
MYNWIIGFFIIQIIHFLGTWRLYQKAGRKSWEAATPIYNLMVMLKINQRPLWWAFLFFLPIICVVMYGVLWVDFIRCFGKRSTKDTWFVLITLGGYIYYLNYTKHTQYIGPEDRKETIVSAMLFAIVFASFIHTNLVQPFTIPTPSMERTLLVGDFMFVSKVHYGLRIPITPIGVPFTHNTLPVLGIKSYVDCIRLPYMRLPAIDTIKRHDIVVFNSPTDFTHTAPDRKDNYIKRCVALPGDVLEIRDGSLFVNGQPEQPPQNVEKQYAYIIRRSEIPLNLDYLQNQMGIKDIQILEDEEYTPDLGNATYVYQIMLTQAHAEVIKSFDNVISVEKNIFSKTFKGETIFPKNYEWNRDFYGPLQIPKKGDCIRLDPDNIETYRNIITKYEGNTLEEQEERFYINGQETSDYTIEGNYYFMMGDNRHNSLDSRYFGFVPEDHIVGKPIFTWFSIDWDRDNPINIFKWKFRWDRIMTLTNEEGRKKTSYLPYVLGVLGVYFIYLFVNDKRNKKTK